MPVVMTAASVVAATSGLVSPSSITIGAAFWQGIGLLLMLPFLVAYYLAWRREPILATSEEERKLEKKWRRVRFAIMVLYIAIGVALFVILVVKGI